jgi:hypothetical protein
VREFARRLEQVFRSRLVGVYLGGSFSTHEWRPGSDYDVVVILTEEPTKEDVDGLRTLHATLAREDPQSLLLEGDYIALGTLVPEGTTRPAWWFRKGSLRDPLVMMSADNVANLGRDGIAIIGPPAASVFPEVSADQIRSAVREMMAEEPDRSSENSAAREILDLARSLRALESGEPSSRAAGYEWALRSLDARWREVLTRAVVVNAGGSVADDDDTLRRALVDIRRSLGLAV